MAALRPLYEEWFRVEVRDTIQQSLYRLLTERKSVWQ